MEATERVERAAYNELIVQLNYKRETTAQRRKRYVEIAQAEVERHVKLFSWLKADEAYAAIFRPMADEAHRLDVIRVQQMLLEKSGQRPKKV